MSTLHQSDGGPIRTLYWPRPVSGIALYSNCAQSIVPMSTTSSSLLANGGQCTSTNLFRNASKVLLSERWYTATILR